jgi:DNA-binding NarL/FixJ family response regulator
VIRVVLVDDHRLVRAGLQSLLEASDDIEVVGSAADGQVEPDVVLMDLSMPRMGGPADLVDGSGRPPPASRRSTPRSPAPC